MEDKVPVIWNRKDIRKMDIQFDGAIFLLSFSKEQELLEPQSSYSLCGKRLLS